MSRLANAAIVVSALLLTLSTGRAQSQYRFENWTTDNGLPQNGVRGVGQMPDGYLWFTTFDGLVRFDGVRFTVFDKSNTQGIYSNRFSTLQIETDGTLLAGTEDGCLTSYHDGTFRSYTAAEGLPGNNVWVDFGRDKDGQTFVVTDLGRFYFREGRFQPVAGAALPGEGRFYLGPTGTLWTYDRARELNRSFVQMQYFGYLRRNPNDAPDGNFNGYDFWLNKLNAAGGNFITSEMVKAFFNSIEYRQRFGP